MADLRLGGHVDAASHVRTDTSATIPADELTTHGVIVGMTGSGKTGLGIVLIEEALAAGVPTLLIDPKGDLTNLALTFPNLAPAEFEPWVNESDAARAGQGVQEFAAAEATRWGSGLAGWGLGTAQVRALHDAAPVTIYTPGAPHGVSLNIIGSLDAPADMNDPQAVADEIEAYVSSLLNLVGIEADPLSSREHILLSTIINHAWGQGRSLDLATLVASVQQPPVRKVGVLDLDTYYPADDRTKLALKLNGLLASPAFASWLGGQRIDIDAMLRSPDGGPRCAIVTTAHLSDEQRQSVTSVVLAKLISWMRRQSGTSDLRAVLYMDEVAGYLPPVGNPPTKEPLMLLLKQARAFGVGVVLSTQNPVDVDYKALSNAGTWLIGRLQTEQDKARLLDGLTSAAGTIDPRVVGDTISALGRREFVLKRASRDQVDVLTTRWAMSYLRGPLTRDQIASLGQAGGSTTGVNAAPPGTVDPVQVDAGKPIAEDETPVPPRVAEGIPVHHLDPAASWAASVGAVPGKRLAPAVIARVRMRFDDTRSGLVHDEEYEAVLHPITPAPTGADFRGVDYDDRDLLPDPPPGAVYRLAPPEIASKPWWTRVQSDLADHLYRSRTVEIPANAELKLFGRVDESADAFAGRCRDAAADAGDQEVSALRTKYERKLADLLRRIDTAQDAVARAQSARTSTMASDLIGGLLGGRRSVGASMRRASTAQGRVSAAADKVETLQEQLADVQAALDSEVAAIRAEWDARATAVSTVSIPLEKSDVSVASIGLVWIPIGA
jgi:Helicase HerA, central domain